MANGSDEENGRRSPAEPARGFAAEFVQFVREHKKLWLIPLVLVGLLLAAALLMSPSGALAPFVYPQ